MHLAQTKNYFNSYVAFNYMYFMAHEDVELQDVEISTRIGQFKDMYVCHASAVYRENLEQEI